MEKVKGSPDLMKDQQGDERMMTVIKRLAAIAVVLMIIPGTLASCSIIEGGAAEDSSNSLEFDIFSYVIPEGYKQAFWSRGLINLTKEDADQDHIETMIGLSVFDEEGLAEWGFDPSDPDHIRESLAENGYDLVTIADCEAATSKLIEDGECYQYESIILSDENIYYFWMQKDDPDTMQSQAAPLTEENIAEFDSFLGTLKIIDETEGQ